MCSGGRFKFSQFKHLLHAAPNGTDVPYPDKLELDVGIIVYIVVALPFRMVCHGVAFQLSVNDAKEVTSQTGFSGSLEYLLVFQAQGTEAGQGLAAPADGGVVTFTVVKKGRESLWFAPEYVTPHYRAVTNLGTYSVVG